MGAGRGHVGPDAVAHQQTYRIAGRDAQHAFWGQGNVVAQSMLHQLAVQAGR